MSESWRLCYYFHGGSTLFGFAFGVVGRVKSESKAKVLRPSRPGTDWHQTPSGSVSGVFPQPSPMRASLALAQAASAQPQRPSRKRGRGQGACRIHAGQRDSESARPSGPPTAKQRNAGKRDSINYRLHYPLINPLMSHPRGSSQPQTENETTFAKTKKIGPFCILWASVIFDVARTTSTRITRF